MNATALRAVLAARDSSPSLMDGWLPRSVEVVAGAVLIGVVLWPRKRCGLRLMGVALVLGLAAVLAGRWALQDSGASGDTPPPTLWLSTFATGSAGAVLAAGWRGRSGWWRNAAALAVALCSLSTGLVINSWIGYFPTVAVTWDQLTRQPLPHQSDWATAASRRGRDIQPGHGELVAVETGHRSSGFMHRREWVYLPPSWFRGDGVPLPAVLMVGGEFGTPADWIRAGQASAAADRFAQAHNGNAPILVFADATGAFGNDTECVNGVRGRAADHLTADVVPDIIQRFGAGADPAHWSIAGFSSGGTCAVDLAVMHPELFGRFVDIAGDERPNVGTDQQTVQRLFAGDRNAWASFEPTRVMGRHGRYARTAGLFIVPESAQAAGDAAHRLCDAGAAQGVRCSIVELPGRHTWPFAASAFETALPWLADPDTL